MNRRPVFLWDLSLWKWLLIALNSGHWCGLALRRRLYILDTSILEHSFFGAGFLAFLLLFLSRALGLDGVALRLDGIVDDDLVELVLEFWRNSMNAQAFSHLFNIFVIQQARTGLFILNLEVQLGILVDLLYLLLILCALFALAPLHLHLYLTRRCV